ncbi:PI31 proteasome regulator N-terminal-domain-containing protein [Cokeromyces recurvatus]|uniref:PI31 proteasome regulator N-terminal-domain-containing protein n=1 Tax=Cokeromyces recurvatus TaxID=90255 RepID=UPI00221F13BD|nr:PI31 proteasome regulator N-terminal-domain-containing protein [Cokeromyces recurvatus]KAI7907006.1 PI31 proteasome regulator N-terminal-domain-containing protein [Cokeromyces recurvatus]
MSEKHKENILDPSVILHSTSQIATELKDPYDAIAAATHAIMLSVGFRFAGLGDDARQGIYACSIYTYTNGDGNVRKLPEEWNANGPHNYNFRYSHPQSSLTFVIKIVRLGGKCIILGLGIGDNKTAILDISTEDYTSASFFPYNTSSTDRPLVHGFISSNRFEDFIKAFKLNIIQRLIPGLNKPGYEDNSSVTNTAAITNEPNPNTERNPTTRVPIPGSADFDDPAYPDVGGSDLRPLGGVRSGIRMPGSGDGMFVGPDHPIFGNRSGNRSSLDDPSGLFGGPEPLPRGSVPPGARFDPIGPFGRLPVRPPGRGGNNSRPRRPFSGEPDNDELLPPVNYI